MRGHRRLGLNSGLMLSGTSSALCKAFHKAEQPPSRHHRFLRYAVCRAQRAMRSAIQAFSDSMLLVNPPQRIRLTPKT